MVARVVIDIKNDREVKNMTLELFEAKLKKAKASRSGIAFIGLLKREVVALDPSTGEVSQLSIDDLADKLD